MNTTIDLDLIRGDANPMSKETNIGAKIIHQAYGATEYETDTKGFTKMSHSHTEITLSKRQASDKKRTSQALTP